MNHILRSGSKQELMARLARIEPPDPQLMQRASAHWNSLCKPLHALGELEQLIIRLAGITGQTDPRIERRAVAVFCADNGVVAQGVSQTGPEVTAAVVRNFVQDKATINQFARWTGADVFPVDLGVRDLVADEPGVIQARILPLGTRDFSQEPAMQEEELLTALFTGWEVASRLVSRGYQVLIGVEMGIGNTTTSAAVVSCLLGQDPKELTGRGAGLSDAGLSRKVTVIREALIHHQPDAAEPLEVLHCVGGLDLAALTGFYLGAAAHRVPVMLDGLISLTAALAAYRLCPAARSYWFASHLPSEQGGQAALAALGLTAPLHLSLAAGEGAGGLLLLPLLDMTLEVYRKLPTFSEGQVEAYQDYTAQLPAER